LNMVYFSYWIFTATSPRSKLSRSCSFFLSGCHATFDQILIHMTEEIVCFGVLKPKLTHVTGKK